MTVKTYLLSLPERLIRSTVGLGAGVAREVSEVALPDDPRYLRRYPHELSAASSSASAWQWRLRAARA